MKNLLKNISDFEKRLKGKPLSLFLDFDGTLAPIVARPESAELCYSVRTALKRLARLCPTVVISGRAIADVKGRVGVDGVVYAGNHGMEIRGDLFSFTCDTGVKVKKELARLRKVLQKEAKGFKGVLVEDKGVTLSVHYRLLDARDVSAFSRTFDDIAAPSAASGLVRVTKGKKVFELRPPCRWHKGTAVTWLLERGPFVATAPVYVGDDETDMDGFGAVKDRGVSVYVGGARKEADFFLKNQDEVVPLLELLKKLAK